MNSEAAPADYTRLCRLIYDYLTPYTDSNLSFLTKDTERSLLIHLSQVYTEIKKWTQESDYDSENELVAKPVNIRESLIVSNLHSDDHHCLIEVIGDLIGLLAVENPFIHHLVGNTLVAISEFVVAFELDWEEFMHSMRLCLKLALDTDPKNSQFDTSVPILKQKLKRANLSTASAIIRSLRNILKLLKQDFTDQKLKVYLDSICLVISDIPWDIVCVKSAEPKCINIFQANLLQLFCSLLDKDIFTDSTNNQTIISTISNIVPKLLAWCLGDPKNSDNTQIFLYFKHKILMLLIRLSSHISFDCSWLNLIHQCFQDLLNLPITSLESDQNNCLKDSPFSDTKSKIVTPYHLQRQAVFLFLKCSFNLISLKEKTCEQCVCTNTSLNTNSKCGKMRGLFELHKWLKVYFPGNIYEDNNMYTERCASFSISLLQLYMHEDDILFKMLLQLFVAYSIIKGEASLILNDDNFVLISDIFNPINMFHLFLNEIHYDHQVLLDYLISKDSGASSAEYLLRSLRLICDSWNLFVEFPDTGTTMSHLDQKRRKVSAYESEHGISKRVSFEDAKDCLFSLRKSIENLNEKGLFPYNPQVLLLRLKRFQELCQMSVVSVGGSLV